MGRKYKYSKGKRHSSYKRRSKEKSDKHLSMPTISLEVTEEVLEQLHSMATLNKNETCGVLTGSITTYGVCRINKISPILITNANSKYACIRDAGKANKFINEEFERSNGTRVYFGEWHTHPENNPTSSSIDRKAIREIYKEARCPVGLVFFAIVGLVGIYWECFDGNSFVRITPIIV